MATEKTIYGRVTCPICHTSEGVRITKDKNGEPFGFCDADCEVQIRIGGKANRVAKFYKQYPAIAAAMLDKPIEVQPVAEIEPEQQPIETTPPTKKYGLILG